MHKESLFRYLLGFGVLAGFLLSPALWGIGERSFPVSPFLPWLPGHSTAFDLIFVPLLLGSMGVFAVFGKKMAGYVFIVSALCACALDLNRLQPWLYLYLLLTGACIAGSGGRTGDYWRLIIGCMYVWSGILKINPLFTGPAVWWLLSPFVTLDPASPVTHAIGIGMALAELLIGLLFLLPRTVKIGAAGAMVLHVLVFLSIGPLGLGWNPVVWPWNLFMVLTACVFLAMPATPVVASLLPLLRRAYGRFLSLAVGFLPLLGLFGMWDAYLSFALYTNNTDVSSVLLPASAVTALPEEIARHAMQPAFASGRLLDVQPWAMEDIGVPPYPELRSYRSLLRMFCRDEGIEEARLYVRRQRTLMGGGDTRVFGCGDL